VSRCEEFFWCQWDCSNRCLQLFLIVALVNKYVKVGSFETNEIALKLVPWIVLNGCLDETIGKCYPCKRHYVNCKKLLKTNWSFLMHVSLVFVSSPQTFTFFNTISTLHPPLHINRWSCSTLLCVVSLDFLIVGIGGHLLVPLMVLSVPVVMWINCSKRFKTSKN
jgi:hypothetical protein